MPTLQLAAALFMFTGAGADEQAPIPAPRLPIETAPAPDPFSLELEVGAEIPTFAYAEQLMAVGKLPEAARVLRRISKNDLNNIVARERLREVYVEARRPDLLPSVLVELIELYQKGGDGERAGQRYDELLAAAPDTSEKQRLGTLIGRLGGEPQQKGTTWEQRARSFLGIFFILGIAYALSTARRAVKLRVILWGTGLQLLLAVIVLWTPPGRAVFDAAQLAVDRVIQFSDEGARFLFGNLYLGVGPGTTSGPLQLVDATTHSPVSMGFIFAFHVLPTIVFIGALMGVMYHLGIIQFIVRGIAWGMMKTMGTSGAESLSTAVNIFVGQTEAPLIVKPYLSKMTASELHAIMVGGFATVAGGVLAAYVRFGIDAGHLLAASFMGGPATLVLAKIMVPETEVPETLGQEVKDPPKTSRNIFDAAAGGASEGLMLALNVGAMLVAFIALVAMVNWALGFIGISLSQIFGYMFYPLSWCMGVDTKDLLVFGNLMGQKLAINEFVAYIDLARVKSQISERTFVIATYALCGFANFSSIGIQIGGMAAMAPERRQDIAALGVRAMIAGALATAMTACVAGLLV